MKKLLIILLILAAHNAYSMEESNTTTSLLSKKASLTANAQSIQAPPRQTMTNDHRSCNNVSCCDGCSQEDKCKVVGMVCLLGLSATVIFCP